MSRATNQALALLSVVAGCLKTMRESRPTARVDMQETIADAYETTAQVIEQWPGTGDEHKNCSWITDKVHGEWREFLLQDRDEAYAPAALAAVCERIMADLSDKIKDRKKLALLAMIEDPLHKIHDFFDRDGANFPAYQKSDFLLDELYRIIEWRE